MSKISTGINNIPVSIISNMQSLADLQEVLLKSMRVGAIETQKKINDNNFKNAAKSVPKKSL